MKNFPETLKEDIEYASRTYYDAGPEDRAELDREVALRTMRSFELACHGTSEYTNSYDSEIRNALAKIYDSSCQHEIPISGLSVHAAYIASMKNFVDDKIPLIAVVAPGSIEESDEDFRARVREVLEEGVAEIEYAVSSRFPPDNNPQLKIFLAECNEWARAHKEIHLPVRLAVHVPDFDDFLELQRFITAPAMARANFIKLDMHRPQGPNVFVGDQAQVVAAAAAAFLENSLRSNPIPKTGPLVPLRPEKLPGLIISLAKVQDFEHVRKLVMVVREMLGRPYVSPDSFRFSSGKEGFSCIATKMKNLPPQRQSIPGPHMPSQS